MNEFLYKDYISWIDLILVPVYFFLLYGVVVIVKNLNPGKPLVQKYMVKGFVFKSVGGLIYGLLIYYYYGLGDSISYFRDALYLKQQIAIGSESFGILFQDFKYPLEVHDIVGAGTEGGWLVERIALVLSYISFSRFLVVTLFFSAIAYSGIFRMFQVFTSLMPEWHKRTAFIILFFPSLAIYGSGILKDTLCMAALGWMVYSGYEMFTKKKFTLRNVVILVLSFYIILTVKMYIIAAFIVPFLFFAIGQLVKVISNPLLRRLAVPMILFFVLITYFSISDVIDEKLGNYAIEKLFDTVKEQQKSYLSMDQTEAGSVFNIGYFEPTFNGFLQKMPEGITAALFRPFIWEARKPIMLFSALESLFILLFTIYVIIQAGVFTFFRKWFGDSFVFLCLTYSILFAAIVGLSTLNFGTLARYRIPAIPFYLIGLLMILYYAKVISPKKQVENTA